MFSCFCACAGFSSSVHTFYKGSCPKSECRSWRLMAATAEKSWEVLWCGGTFAEAVVPVPHTMVPVPQSRKSPVAFCTGTTLTGTDTGTNMSFLQDLSRIPTLVQGHACLSPTTLRSLKRRVFKRNEGVERIVFDSRVLILESESIFLIFFLGFIE